LDNRANFFLEDPDMATVTKCRRGKTWWLRYAKRTELRPRSLGTKDAHTAELIRTEDEHRLVMRKEGLEVEAPRAVRYSQLVQHVLERKRAMQRARETINAITASLNNFGDFLKVDEQLHSISSERIEAYIAHRFAAGRMVKTIRNEVLCLGNAFKIAMRMRWIRENPVAFVELPKIDKKPPRFLTREQYKLLMAKVSDEEFRDIIDFYLVTGARRTEGTQIKLSEHVDFHTGVLRIPQSKQHDFREIPIDRRLGIIIRRLMLRSGGSDNLIRYDPDKLTEIFGEYIEAADLPEAYTFHVLRHTCATWRAAAGTPWNVLRAFMGHKDPESTKVYTHTYESRDTLAASRLVLPRN
jgi:integrase/recombinase XerD